MAKTLLEQITREGKIGFVDAPASGLSDSKLIAADQILTGIQAGEHAAVSAFKSHLGCRVGEAIHTTGDDFLFAFGQLTAMAVTDEWEAATRTWTEAIETETTSSFKAPKFYSINPITEGFARPQSEPGKPAHIVPIVPEGQNYPHFKFSGELAKSGKLAKAGGQYDLTFEQIIEDVVGLVPLIPKLITESLLERQEYDAWVGLLTLINEAANHLQAGTTLDGQAVPADAPLSRAAMIAAIEQLAQREIIPGRKIQVSAWRLLVPRGGALRANFFLNQLTMGEIITTDGLVQRSMTSTYNPLQGIVGVTETDYLTDTQWAIIPNKGAISGPRKFYKYGQLIGHEGPELRVENVTGQYLGGGQVAPFEGSFKTDSAAFRGRIIGGGLGWESAYGLISDGDGVITP